MSYQGIAGAALIAIMLMGCERQAANDAAATNTGNETVADARSGPSDPEIVEGLSGRTAQVALADGRKIEVRHNVDGTARMTGPDGLDKTGRWMVTNGQLCFDWPGQPRECWPYGGPLTPGKSVQSTSDRGQVITTTLVDSAPSPTDAVVNGSTSVQ